MHAIEQKKLVEKTAAILNCIFWDSNSPAQPQSSASIAKSLINELPAMPN
jgi:hypothetical protein